jgi:hypothetical protein
MNTPTQVPAHRHNLIAFLTLLMVVGVMSGLYMVVNLKSSGHATPVMPLDDTYIHFQYARALADGHFMQYNPGHPPTSGATSFAYPALLALGYKLGFTAERLSWWALSIGVLCWFGSAWLTYLITRRDELSRTHWIALGFAALFALTGSLGWAFMSGMETGLTIFLTLLIVYYAVQNDRGHTLLSATIGALVRPELLVVAVLTAIYFALKESSRRTALRHLPLYVIPILFGLVQPLLNTALTGSATASGMVAKSYLYNMPPDKSGIISNILTTFGRTLIELLFGNNPDDGQYLPLLLPLLALLGLTIGIYRAWKLRQLTPELLIFGMLLTFAASVSILETAFWQFKRYQQPIFSLLFPLAGWAVIYFDQKNRKQNTATVALIFALLLISTIPITAQFLHYYSENVREVTASQLRMAYYVDTKLPTDAVVAVHDIGVMRYFGNRSTYDVVGLTTPGAAKAWRNGPGAVYEQMLTSPYRPDHFAIYRDARGLTYLADTDLYKEKLAEFPSTNPTRNIASATSSGQAVYKADWTFAKDALTPLQPSSVSAVEDMSLVDSINVANLPNEDAHAYRWWEMVHRSGFATELYELNYISCQPPTDNPACRAMDGGRLITGGEEMTIATTPGQDLIWVTRVHPRNTVGLKLFINGNLLAVRIIPSIPGQWLEYATLIPASQITTSTIRLRVEANIIDPNAGFYMPYYHWFYQGHYKSTPVNTSPRATFGQSTLLLQSALTYNSDQRAINMTMTWQRGSPDQDQRDAKLFIHVLDHQGKIVAQSDQRVGNGTLPPANWLPGPFEDTLSIPASTVPAGTYRVFIGLYDPLTNERWVVTGDGADQDRRLLIGTITLP